MENQKTKITVETIVNDSIEKVWNFWTLPEHIMNWNNASTEWHTPKAENELKAGGKFLFRMEAKDGSFGFDFCGVYDKVMLNKHIEYTLAESRKVIIEFSSKANKTKIVETFEAENQNPDKTQQSGWQSILDNFKKYTETKLK